MNKYKNKTLHRLIPIKVTIYFFKSIKVYSELFFIFVVLTLKYKQICHMSVESVSVLHLHHPLLTQNEF